ncbi:MAG: hypothetical protein WAW37_18150, partial [Syntrophobacteraceae bacterium]
AMGCAGRSTHPTNYHAAHRTFMKCKSYYVAVTRLAEAHVNGTLRHIDLVTVYRRLEHGGTPVDRRRELNTGRALSGA